MLPDYYSILGIPRDASYLEIKAAYRSLAKKHHPDKHGGDLRQAELFKEISEAYTVLSHTDTKFSYDKHLQWQEKNPSPVAPAQTTYRRRPPVYAPPPPQPYQYSSWQSSSGGEQYVYSKWTLMYGKIFVVGLIMLVVLLPISLEYYFSTYYYNRGIIDLANKNYYEAEKNFKEAMRDLGGRNTIAAIKVAEMKIANNSDHKALSYIKTGLRYAVRTPYRAQLYYLRGVAEHNLKHPHKAVIALENAQILNYNQDSVYTVLAPIYAYELNNYAKAIMCYDSLIIHNPDNTDNYLNRGFCYQKLDKHEAAINDFNYFINNKGINGSVLFLKAISQISLGEMDNACSNFKKSKELGIENAETFIKTYCTTDTTNLN